MDRSGGKACGAGISEKYPVLRRDPLHGGPDRRHGGGVLRETRQIPRGIPQVPEGFGNESVQHVVRGHSALFPQGRDGGRPPDQPPAKTASRLSASPAGGCLRYWNHFSIQQVVTSRTPGGCAAPEREGAGGAPDEDRMIGRMRRLRPRRRLGVEVARRRAPTASGRAGRRGRRRRRSVAGAAEGSPSSDREGSGREGSRSAASEARTASGAGAASCEYAGWSAPTATGAPRDAPRAPSRHEAARGNGRHEGRSARWPQGPGSSYGRDIPRDRTYPVPVDRRHGCRYGRRSGRRPSSGAARRGGARTGLPARPEPAGRGRSPCLQTAGRPARHASETNDMTDPT